MVHRPRLPAGSLFLLAVILLAGSVSGQFAIDPPPANSAYWWTLSDDIEPAELRHRLQSRRLSRERLQADVKAGLHQPVSAERLAQLSVYVNGAVTPELLPMWDAFDVYAFRFRGHRKNYPEQALEELTAAGMSPEGAALTITVVEEHLRIEADVIEETRGPAHRFAFDVMASARNQIGEKAANRVVRDKDFPWLARLSGQSEETVRTWHRAWLRDPMAEAGLVSLETLRDQLSEADWQVLRSFLLHNIASRIDHEYFSERGFR